MVAQRDTPSVPQKYRRMISGLARKWVLGSKSLILGPGSQSELQNLQVGRQASYVGFLAS